MKKENLNDIIKEKGIQVNYDRVNRLVLGLAQLDGLMYNFLDELEAELKIGGLCRQEIKQNINIIRNKLKSNPKINWDVLSADDAIIFGDDGEIFERTYKGMIGLAENKVLTITLLHNNGSKVWFMSNNKATLGEIKGCESSIHNNGTGVSEESIYTIEVLHTRTQKPTGDMAYIKEDLIMKSKKDVLNVIA